MIAKFLTDFNFFFRVPDRNNFVGLKFMFFNVIKKFFFFAIFILNRERINMGRSITAIMLSSFQDGVFLAIMAPLVYYTIGRERLFSTIDMMNMVRYFLPHLLALSTSSPFWMGRNTGLKSFRTTVFRRFPRTGIPEIFESWSAYENFVNLLIKLNCIDTGKKIWWDVRPHPTFGTLEFRMCDVPTRVEETVAIAALTQALVVKLHRLYTGNMGWRIYRRALIEENKWRAARYGIEGKLIDLGKETEVPTRELVPELLEFVDDVLDELGSRSAVEYIHTILNEGTSAERQLRVFEQTGDLKEVVRHLVAETRASTMDTTKSTSASTIN